MSYIKRTSKEVDFFLENLDDISISEKVFAIKLSNLLYLTNCNILTSKPISSRTKFHCSDRKNLTRGKVGVIDLIKCGILDNMKVYILKSTRLKNPDIRIHDAVEFNGPNVQDFIQPLEKWVGCDEFTNESIINWILNKVIKEYSTTQYLAFICGNTGYQVQEKADMDLSNYMQSPLFNPQNLDRMIYQVVSQLNFLEKNYNFIHGDMKAKNVLVYKKGKVAKISDYGKSSITYKKYRFYCRLEEAYKRKVVGFFQTSSIPVNKTYTFNLPDLDTVVALRHRREIFYLNFDIYTFMVSIVLERKIFEEYLNPQEQDKMPFFNQFWKFLWVDEKTQKLVETRIQALLENENVNLYSYNPLMGILRGLRLKYF